MLKQTDIIIVKNDNAHNNYKYNKSYLKEFIDFIIQIKKAYLSFSESINEILNKKYNFFEDNKNIFYFLMTNLKNHLLIEIIEYKDLSNLLTKEIIEKYKIIKTNNDKNEEKLIKDYSEVNKKIKKAKLKLDEYQNLFFTKMKDTEKLIVEEKSTKINTLTSNQEIKEKNLIASEAVRDSMKIEEKYKNYLKEVNNLIDEINTIENKLAEFYKNSEEQILNKIKEYLFLLMTIITTTNSKINFDIENIKKNCVDIKFGNEIKSLLEVNKYILSNLKKIEFKPYVPFSSLNNSIKSCSKNEEMNTNYEVITYLQDYFTDICKNLDMEEEKRRKKLRTLCFKIFNDNQNYGKEDQNEMIKFMQKEDYRKYFIITLTKQRTDGVYKREEKLLIELKGLFEVILDIAEKEKNFELTRNCIILSQTFYYEKNINGKNEKIYLMEYIKTNKWLCSCQFWKEFIEDEIIKEKIKFKEENKKRENGKNIMDVTKIYFGKIITYSHNMHMFGLTKEQASNIINYFIEKYEISEDMIKTIIANLETVYMQIKIEKKEKIPQNNGSKGLENNDEIKNEIINGNNIINDNGINNDNNKNEIKNEGDNNLNNNNDNNIKNEDKKDKEKKEEDKKDNNKDKKTKEKENKAMDDDWVIEGDGYGF